MMMYAIFCNGLRGSALYSRYDEAVAAAQWRTMCTGLEWTVQAVKAGRA